MGARGCAMGAHRRRTKTNLISGETVLSPLLADLRSPPGFSLLTYCFQTRFCSATVRAFTSFSDLLSSRALISCSLPLHEGFWNAEDSLAGARQPDALESLALAFLALAGARAMALVLVSMPALLPRAHPIITAAMLALAEPQLRCDWSTVARPGAASAPAPELWQCCWSD
jgi:hypothetical protein